jgi:hypothetical protein
MDFVHDQLAMGRKLCVLTIVNSFSRLSPAGASVYVPPPIAGSANSPLRRPSL